MIVPWIGYNDGVSRLGFAARFLLVWLLVLLIAGLWQREPRLVAVSAVGLLALLPTLFWRGEASTEAAVSSSVSALDGEEFLWRVERAPRPSWWKSGPWSMANALKGDQRWWLTAWSADRTGPLVRERYATRPAALEAARAWADAVETGQFAPPSIPPVRRRDR